MFIRKNMIEGDLSDGFYRHDAKILYGKPQGTYFFRNHTNGQIALVFSAGGTKIGILTIDTKPDGKIAITNLDHKRSFDSEAEFLRFAKEEGLSCPAFPKSIFKLNSSVNELKYAVPSLKYLTTLSILKNPTLSEKVWECEDQKLLDELEDYFESVDDQLDAEKVSRRFKR